MEESFNLNVCSICLNNFTKPKIIGCFHTYCEVCLESYVKKSSVNNQFPCPLCRKWIAIPKGGVKEFVNNFYIKDTPTDTEIEVCPIHSDDKSDKYCKHCSMVACSRCLEVNHKSHQILCLDDAREVATRGLEDCKQTMQDQLSKLNEYIDNVRIRISDIQEHQCRVATEIEEHVEKVVEAVRHCGKELISQVTETSIREERKLHSLIGDTKQFIHQSEAIRNYGSLIVKKNSVEDMINVQKLITKQCKENENRRLKPIPIINNLIFHSAGSVPPSDLMDYIGSLERIQEDILEYSFNIDRIKNGESYSPIFGKGHRNWQIIAGVDTLSKGKSFLYICIKMVGKKAIEEGGREEEEEEEEEKEEKEEDEEEEEEDEEEEEEEEEEEDVFENDSNLEEDTDDISAKISLKLLNVKSYQQSVKVSQHHTFTQEDTTLEFSKIIYVKNMIKEGFINKDQSFMVRACLEYSVD